MCIYLYMNIFVHIYLFIYIPNLSSQKGMAQTDASQYLVAELSKAMQCRSFFHRTILETLSRAKRRFWDPWALRLRKWTHRVDVHFFSFLLLKTNTVVTVNQQSWFKAESVRAEVMVLSGKRNAQYQHFEWNHNLLIKFTLQEQIQFDKSFFPFPTWTCSNFRF